MSDAKLQKNNLLKLLFPQVEIFYSIFTTCKWLRNMKESSYYNDQRKKCSEIAHSIEANTDRHHSQSESSQAHQYVKLI